MTKWTSGLTAMNSFPFKDAFEAFKATQAGKSDDGKPVIKAIISGPDVSPDDHM